MKLPAKIKARWVEALRSGKYTQTKGTLCNGTSYCCLGVLQDVTEGKIETYSPSYMSDAPGEFLNEPTADFWERIGAEVSVLESEYADGGDEGVDDKQVSQLIRMNDGHLWYDAKKSKMRQTRKRSFNKIAEWIEKHVETF